MVGHERDLFTVGRQCRSKVFSLVCQLYQICTVGIYSVDVARYFEFDPRNKFITTRDKGNPFSVRRPRRCPFALVVGCESPIFSCSCVHDINLEISVSVGDISQEAPIRRPRGFQFTCRMVCQVTVILSVGIHDVDIKVSCSIGSEGDPLAFSSVCPIGYQQ